MLSRLKGIETSSSPFSAFFGPALDMLSRLKGIETGYRVEGCQ